MSDDAIFLLQGDNTLVEMREGPYTSEDLLQRLLEQYPALLAGEQMNRTSPRRWVLIRREAGIPSSGTSADRWSIDHLFLDQEGIPTLVEVKRSSDTRIRREVVGQMLDYAANALMHWPVERIRIMFEERCKAVGVDPDVEIGKLLDREDELLLEGIEEFWSHVERNFQARRIRMVFVADIIPDELRAIVEFLNEQMKQIEVLAVEVKQYIGPGATTLVPRVFGMTVEAQQVKGQQRTKVLTDEANLLEGLTEAYAIELRRLFDACRGNGLRITWGTIGCSIQATAVGRKAPLSLAWVNPPGRAGWSGLTNVTLGVDRNGVEFVSPHLLDEVDRYVREVASFPGASRARSMATAYSFAPEEFVKNYKLIEETIINCADKLKPTESSPTSS